MSTRRVCKEGLHTGRDKISCSVARRLRAAKETLAGMRRAGKAMSLKRAGPDAPTNTGDCARAEGSVGSPCGADEEHARPVEPEVVARIEAEGHAVRVDKLAAAVALRIDEHDLAAVALDDAVDRSFRAVGEEGRIEGRAELLGDGEDHRSLPRPDAGDVGRRHLGGTGAPAGGEGGNQEADRGAAAQAHAVTGSALLFSARFRAWGSRIDFRSRIDFGVTSTNSSSWT